MTKIIKEPTVNATHCVIWMHGLGASNQDMIGVVDALNITNLPIRHVSLQAPNIPVTINMNMLMPAWYDIKGQQLTDRQDKEGILSSDKLIASEIAAQESQGIPTSNIFLAGFSQGGAMALYSGLHHPQFLAGIIALSCYLPLDNECEPTQRKSLPIFLAYGNVDPVVLPEWSKLSYKKLSEKGFSRISIKNYQMMHEISTQEIDDLREWIKSRVS